MNPPLSFSFFIDAFKRSLSSNHSHHPSLPPSRQCTAFDIDLKKLKNKIVLCQRLLGYPPSLYSYLVEGGAKGVIFYTSVDETVPQAQFFSYPAVALSVAQTSILRRYFSKSRCVFHQVSLVVVLYIPTWEKILFFCFLLSVSFSFSFSFLSLNSCPNEGVYLNFI